MESDNNFGHIPFIEATVRESLNKKALSHFNVNDPYR